MLWGPPKILILLQTLHGKGVYQFWLPASILHSGFIDLFGVGAEMEGLPGTGEELVVTKGLHALRPPMIAKTSPFHMEGLKN